MQTAKSSSVSCARNGALSNAPSNDNTQQNGAANLAAPFLFAALSPRLDVRVRVCCAFYKRINTHQKCKKHALDTFCTQLKKTIPQQVMHLRNTPVHSFAKPQRNKQLSGVALTLHSTEESTPCHRHTRKCKRLTAFQRFWSVYGQLPNKPGEVNTQHQACPEPSHVTVHWISCRRVRCTNEHMQTLAAATNRITLC